MIFGKSEQEKRQLLANTLTQMSWELNAIMNKPETWDNRILSMQKLSKAIPLVIRMMIYFKNTDGGRL